MKIGVVADDITGSNDIGIMFARWGYVTHIYAHDHFPQQYTAALQQGKTPDVVIVDTNSRLDSPRIAYEKVYQATRALQALGCRQFHNKTCSVFRGNIGTEFDAMLDALGESFAVVVLGFPKNGRTTVDGIHYVRGVELEESEFQRDPVHPMTRSSLVEILQSQTNRKVAMIDYRVVQSGGLRERLEEMRDEANYVIVDVTDQHDLRTIAEAVYDIPVLCGSSALAEELPIMWDAPANANTAPDLPHHENLGILCAAGSMMPQTAAQIDHMQAQGVPVYELHPMRLLDADESESEVERLADTLVMEMRHGRDVVLRSPHHPQAVEAVRTRGAQMGLEKAEVSRLISDGIAEIVARVVARSGQNRLLIAGGETSAAVCARLGVYGQRVWQEIQPGLPSCISLTDPAFMLVLKSGSFGTPDFFQRAVEHLKETRIEGGGNPV